MTDTRGADARSRGGVESAVAAAALAAVTCLAFLPAFGAGFQRHWDDDWNLLENEHFRGLSFENLRYAFTTFHHGPYQPLSWLSLSFDYVVWGRGPDQGLDPAGFHATNVLLHAVAAVLALFTFRALVRRALPDVAPRRALVSAAVGALVFAVHPLRAESVAWITERRDVLSGVFLLATVLMYLRAVRTGVRMHHALALALFAASLLSKATGVMLPFVLLALDVYPLRRIEGGPGLARRLLRAAVAKAPWFAVSFAVGVVAVIGQARNDTFVPDHGALARVTQSLYGLGFYAFHTLVPRGLSPLYELARFDPLAPSSLAFEGLALVATITLVRFRRRMPAAATAWCAFVLLALPILGVAQAGIQLVADRYSYLACLPLAALFAGVAARIPRPALLLAALALVLTPLTYRQTGIWRDPHTLWEHAVATEPASPLANAQLGYVLIDEERFAEAEQLLRFAAEHRPRDVEVLNALAQARVRQGDIDEAVALWRRSLDVDPTQAFPRENLRRAGVEVSPPHKR